MKTYFISDTHFGCSDMLRVRRDYETVDEMDRVLIDNWNVVVSEEDEVYILGDIVDDKSDGVLKYVEMLNGHKHLIIGNHDQTWIDEMNPACQLFDSISHYKIVELDGYILTMCHYPMLEWFEHQKRDNSFHLHGHIHTRNDRDSYKYIKQKLPKALNCCADINGRKPVGLGELISNNNRWYGRSK